MGKNKEQTSTEEAGSTLERSLAYFASDGNYGDAAGLTVIETTHWSEVDWNLIEEVTDTDRPQLAKVIAESYELETQVPLEELKTRFEQFGINLDDFGVTG
jgi:hypothetical protein